MQTGSTQQARIPDVSLGGDQGLERAKRAAKKGDERETARQFETIFGVMLVRELRRAMPSGLFGEGAGADVYEGWFDEQLGRTLGERDALGIAGMVKTSMQQKNKAASADTKPETNAKPGTSLVRGAIALHQPSSPNAPPKPTVNVPGMNARKGPK